MGQKLAKDLRGQCKKEEKGWKRKIMGREEKWKA